MLHDLLKHNLEQLGCVWLFGHEHQHVSDSAVLLLANLLDLEHLQDKARVHIQTLSTRSCRRHPHRLGQLSIWRTTVDAQHPFLDWQRHANYWRALVG